jgi:hypothetical protein
MQACRISEFKTMDSRLRGNDGAHRKAYYAALKAVVFSDFKKAFGQSIGGLPSIYGWEGLLNLPVRKCLFWAVLAIFTAIWPNCL